MDPLIIKINPNILKSHPLQITLRNQIRHKRLPILHQLLRLQYLAISCLPQHRLKFPILRRRRTSLILFSCCECLGFLHDNGFLFVGLWGVEELVVHLGEDIFVGGFEFP